jgi:omega-hydroxy-beta-dihydromenaquinone-9 sulfotransferase
MTQHPLADGAAADKAKKPAKQRESMPLFWDGMNFPAWFRLITKNRFRLSWQYWYMLPLVTAFSLFHSAYRAWQWIVVGWLVRKKIDYPPLFILGHWRSGTTLLHELLVLDKRHTYPTTYECFAPNHFVITESIATKLLAFMLAPQRPMDNMAAGWHRPQEDEFALCNLGLPSPYLTIAFPNDPPQDQEYLTLEHVPPDALARWKRKFLRFLQEINYRSKRRQRIVLKSPPHTGRVKVLLEMFPDAKFVHIVRDPFVVFPSTVHLWKTLYSTQGMQKPRFEGLEQHVFTTFERMYERFEADRQRIPPGNICEIRYEDLVADPVEGIRRIYEELDLGGFVEARPALEGFVAATKGYETNKYRELAPELRDEIAHRWRGYLEKYGYAKDTARPAPAFIPSPQHETTKNAGNAVGR